MFTTLATQIQSTLHVFGQRMERNQRGQTTAEYVGIVAFVAILVVALFALAPGVSAQAGAIIDSAFAKLGG